jgi:hypothetical protein
MPPIIRNLARFRSPFAHLSKLKSDNELEELMEIIELAQVGPDGPIDLDRQTPAQRAHFEELATKTAIAPSLAHPPHARARRRRSVAA